MEARDDIDPVELSAAKVDPMSLLSEKHKKFVLSYTEHGNGARAAREAGFAEKTARIEASKLLKKPTIKAAVSHFMDAHAMSAGECVGRLTNWGRGSLEPFIRYYDEIQYNILTGQPFVDLGGEPVTKRVAQLDLSTEEARANIHLLKKIKQGQYGLEIELTDPKDAVDKLMQKHGLYKTKIDLSLLTEEQIDDLLDKALSKIS